MKLGIIETGRPAGFLGEKYDPYPVIFERLLRDAGLDHTVVPYAVLDGHIPTDVHACDTWLMTGSPHGVYEDHDWITPLEDLVRQGASEGKRMIGVCFGHQLFAQALGGKVVKSDKGWGAGVHTYRVLDREDWMVTDHEEVSIVVSHQDQVVETPPGAKVLATSDFCENALMTIGDTVMTMQFHPEMTKEFSSDLIDVRRDRMGDSVSDSAKASLAKDVHSADVAKWMAAFLRG